MAKTVRRALLGVLVTLLASGGSAFAQGQGQWGGLLRQFLDQVAQAQCLPSTLSPLALGICQQQQPGIGQQISALGPIAQMSFLGDQQTPMGSAEVYKVDYGQASVLWMIQAGADGKVVFISSQAPVARQNPGQ